MHINQSYQISLLLQCFMLFGVAAASISGAIRAIESKMDITGAILLAFITASAGGTIRDIILNSQVFWIREQIYIWLTCIIGAATFIFIYYKGRILGNRKINFILIVTDAMGIAAFSLAGVEKALALGQNNSIAIIMGVWTAIGGGVIADVISNRVPLVFTQELLYITVAFFGSVCYLILASNINHPAASIIAA
ncbi:MAG: hypothetical protein K0R49_987, partial [Burkholderiales bacterium]|nr:hypothetical protein [Burkholderiales bacterium]